MAEWVSHAVGLPQYVEAFRENSITVRPHTSCMVCATCSVQACQHRPFVRKERTLDHLQSVHRSWTFPSL